MNEKQISALAREIRSRIERLPSRKTPHLRTIRRFASKELRLRSAGDVFSLARMLLDDSDSTPRWFSFELIHFHENAMERLSRHRLNQYLRDLACWGDVDAFACRLAGPTWRKGRIGDDLILRWARSDNRWRRRAALVSTVPLNCSAQGGQGDVSRTLAICTALLADRDEMVVKALSWALRELISKDALAVEQFVVEQAGHLAPRARREVRNKLTTGRKNTPRKQTKS